MSQRVVGVVILASLTSASVALAQPPASNPSAAVRFRTHLDGQQEVPPVETNGQGQFLAVLSPDGQTLTYRLIVANIDNVVQAHIHLGVAGNNGPVVAFLFGAVPPGGGPTSGTLGEGTITAANLVGPLAGQAMSVLVEAMKTGGTYVNVHTDDGIAPPNTGAGDIPSGEVRGQIRQVGRR